MRVVEDGRSGECFQAGCSGDVVDMRVGDEDLRNAQIVPLEDGEDAGDVVAGVNDDGLAGALISQNGAIALQQTDGQDLMDHMRFKVQGSRCEEKEG